MKKHAFADEMARDAELLRRRFVHHTRPKGPMTLDEARELCEQMYPRPGPAWPCPPRSA